MYLSAHPLDQYAFEVKHFTTCSMQKRQYGAPVLLKMKQYSGKGDYNCRNCDKFKISYSRSSGKPFANFTVEDFDGSQTFAIVW
jgi:hypothetical protein